LLIFKKSNTWRKLRENSGNFRNGSDILFTMDHWEPSLRVIYSARNRSTIIQSYKHS